ncbi:hypothetical protein KHQ81_15915 (plasmid) [Mycoplasmatota bacterium]|nr:hypothetical protein KHQ81_15915 [Mycoplasmatota bacterium]
MAYKEDLSSYNQHYSMIQPYPVNQSSIIQPVNYQNLPVKEIYNSYNIRESDDFKTFQRFLKFNDQLSFIEKLEEKGIITINRNEDNSSGEQKDKISPGTFILIFFGIILIMTAIFN